ncbi:DUF883 family protein [bacterium]|nr:DUF883 family protein [bacterium]
MDRRREAIPKSLKPNRIESIFRCHFGGFTAILWRGQCPPARCGQLLLKLNSERNLMENAEFAEGNGVMNPREKIVTDLKTLVNDAEELLRVTAGDLSDKAKDARARLNVALDRARVSAQQWEEKASAGAKATDKLIREHPYQTVGVAFGIGVLLGALINRR